VERMKRVRIFNPLHDWGHEKWSHNLPDACWLHQVIGGKKGWQGAGHFWHIGLVEDKLCRATSIHLRVACSAH
jgi:hypothetical protein